MHRKWQIPNGCNDQRDLSGSPYEPVNSSRRFELAPTFKEKSF